MDAREVIHLIRDQQIQAVDLRFCDLPGLWQHFTISAGDLDEDSFVEGFGFDGSSIRGFQQIQESDMILIPDPSTCFEDPFSKVRTLILICNIADPITQEPYSRDPRYITQKAEKYLVSTGIGDTAYFGPEPEFFVLDDVRFDQSYNHGYYYIDSVEGFWNSGREENPNLGYKPRYKEGYFPVPPMDTLQDMRTEMMLALQDAGIQVEVHHHEVATAGQCEIDMRFDSLVNMGDKLLKFKYIIKNVARRYDKTVTLMPKPIFMDNGSGMHVHQSLWKNGRNVFYGPGTYADLSQEAVYYIGGLPQARRRRPGFRCSDHQLLPAAGSRVRSAGQSHLLDAQPQRLRPNPHLLRQREGQAGRVPSSRSVGQRLPGIRGHAHGRSGRDSEQDHAARSHGQGPLRPAAGRDGRRGVGSGESGIRPWMPWRPTMTFCSRETSSLRT